MHTSYSIGFAKIPLFSKENHSIFNFFIETFKPSVLDSSYNTSLIGKVVYEFESLPSTNLHALELLSKSLPTEGTVISAQYQTQGRGQLGSIWNSDPAQNLTLSVILYPSFLSPNRQFFLSQVAALAVREAVQTEVTDKPVTIKWSNDVLVENRKIAGILIQNSLSGRQIQYSIVGIGVNLNQTNFSFKSQRPPTSLCLETFRTIDKSDFQKRLFFFFEHFYQKLKLNNFDQLQAEYLSHLYKAGVWHGFQTPDGTFFLGRIIGVTEQGRLQVEVSSGQIQIFDLKQIQFL